MADRSTENSAMAPPTDNPDMALPTQTSHRGTDGEIWARQNAAEYRAFSGRVKGMPSDVAQDKAARLDAEADRALAIETHIREPLIVGTGGEVARGSTEPCLYVDTMMQYPDMVAVDASRQRLGLAKKSGGLALALDVAATIRASNTLEKMVSHQIGAAHIAAMGLQAEAMALIGEFVNSDRRYSILTTEAARLINSSARMMDVTQRGMVAINRIRNSGRQTMVVQHVHINNGSQAVVAGQVKSRRRGGRAKRGG